MVYPTGVNTGMMFKLPDSIEEAGGSTTNNKTFASSDCGKYFRPVLYITYTNNCGIESYWDYHTQAAGRAGTGYVNDFTGNLAFVRTDLGVSGNLMPVAIQHIYNANDKQDNPFGCGYGWRTNYNQLVYQWEADTSYYVWEDGDGTKHYFKYCEDFCSAGCAFGNHCRWNVGYFRHGFGNRRLAAYRGVSAA